MRFHSPVRPDADRLGRLAIGILSAYALLVCVALRHAPAFSVAAGSSGDNHFLRGFGPPVRGPHFSFRRTASGCSLVLHGVSAGSYWLTLSLEGPLGRDHLLSLTPTNAKDGLKIAPASFAVHPGWHDYQVNLLLPDAWPPRVEPASLSIESTRPRLGHGPETVTTRVSMIRWDRIGALTLVSILFRVFMLVWALTILGALLWQAGALAGIHAPRSQVAALTVVVAAAAVLAWLARRDPYTLAWAIPPTPVSLALLSIALIALNRRLSAPRERARPLARARLWGLGLWGLALAMLLALYVQRGSVVGPALILAGVIAVLLGAAARGPSAQLPPAETGARAPRCELLALGVILFLALAMRFYLIRSLPYGLWRDEARYGIVALRMIENPTYRPAYVPEVVTLPGLGLYGLSLGIRLWGVTTWSMRTVSALAGALTVVPLYFLLRKLTARSDVALLACALLAVSSWHVTVSRITSPAAMHPFFELVGLVFLMCALDPEARWVHGRPWVRALFAAAGGAAFGVAAQTYHTGRLAPLTAITLFLLSVREAATSARHRALALMAFLLGLLALAAPFLLYAWRQPRDFEARVTRVSLLGAAAANAVAPLTALDQSVGRHALMFNVRGDTNGRRNVPRRPMLDAVTGVGLIAGLLFIAQTRRWQYWFLGAGLLLGVLPSALAVEGPHALRAIGAVPYACAVAAIGWTWLIGPQGRPWRGAAGVGIVLAALTLNAWTYFHVAPCDDRVWKSFYPVETRIGSFIRDLCKREGAGAAERIYVDQDMATSSVVQYLAHGIRVNTFRAKGLSAPIRGEALFLVTDPAQLDQLTTLLERAQASAPRWAGSGPMLPDGSRPAFTIWSALDRR